MDGPVGMEWKGYESVGCWTHYMMFICDPTNDLNSQSLILK